MNAISVIIDGIKVEYLTCIPIGLKAESEGLLNF